MQIGSFSTHDQIMLAIFFCILCQVFLAIIREWAQYECELFFENLTCSILTLTSDFKMLWYVFHNVLAFHIVRVMFENKISCVGASILFVNNLYLGVVAYYIASKLDVEL